MSEKELSFENIFDRALKIFDRRKIARKMPQRVILEELATNKNFNERAYLSANPDVAAAVAKNHFESGYKHFKLYGLQEGRRIKTDQVINEIQAAKFARLDLILRKDLSHRIIDSKFDFLTKDIKEAMGIIETDNVSSHDYPDEAQVIVDEFAEGLVLDFGSGKRSTYYANVVNYDVVNYPTTDVVGVGEILPFKDASFDAVISNAVLEHVKNPARCAAEIARVLKPGGKLWCSVAFLSPVHGYPNHFFNMTAQGVRTLFEPYLEIDQQNVPVCMGPIFGLRWIIHLWAAGLNGNVRQEFLDMKLSDLLKPISEIENADFVTSLSKEKNFELATCTSVYAHKKL